MIKRVIGTCPVTELKIGGASACCLLDTGNKVSTITEELFQKHLSGEEKDIQFTSSWLWITAVNGLEIPYLGYLELEVETMGIKIPDCGFLVVKEPKSSQMTEPCIIGMNIISRCRQLVQSEFHTTLGGPLDKEWRTVFQQMQRCTVDKKAIARVAGRDMVHIPAASIATVTVKGNLKGSGNLETHHFPKVLWSFQHWWVVSVKPSRSKLLISHKRMCGSVREPGWVAWFRLSVDSEQTCEGKFQRISADVEQVTVETKDSEAHRRVQSVLDKLDIGGTVEERAELRALLAKYKAVFTDDDDDDDLGFADKVKHEINLVDEEPVAKPYRRIPPTQYREVQEHISKLLRKDVIQDSSSSYASPVVIVRKADGTIRLCVDYRKLNQKTKKDAFPLPCIDESFDALQGAKLFSTIDLASGYHQVAVVEHDSICNTFWSFRVSSHAHGCLQWTCHISTVDAGYHE